MLVKSKNRKLLMKVVAIVVVATFIILFLAGYVMGPDKMLYKPEFPTITGDVSP